MVFIPHKIFSYEKFDIQPVVIFYPLYLYCVFLMAAVKLQKRSAICI
jgi:hypothetical protein